MKNVIFLLPLLPLALGAQPAPLSGFQDEGTFVINLNESRIGAITFQWKPDGSYRGATHISMAGQTVERSFEVTPDEQGRWAKLSIQDPMGSATAVRDGNNLTYTTKDKTVTVKIEPDALLYQGNAPALLAAIIRRYDRGKGGKQPMPVLAAGGGMLKATLEIKDQVERRNLSITRYTFGLPGADLTVWADGAGKVYLVEIPAQRAEFLREGYDWLRIEPPADPRLSAAKYEVRLERNAGIPMRDGVTLMADIYRPVIDDKAPVILVRTPYRKENQEIAGRYYARRGYVYVVQDVRGCFSSPGAWEPFMNEGRDGYDTVEWVAAQPWSSGKVGMIGASYVGWVQWWAAARKPPHLVTIIPNVSPPDPFFNMPYEYGTFFLMGAIWWADILETKAAGDVSGATFVKVSDKKYGKLLRALPVIDLDKAVLGKENPYWRQWIQHPTNDAYWQPANFLDRLKDVDIPVFHQSGWFDNDGIGAKLNYLRMAAHHAAHQKLVLGPWTHSAESHRSFAGRDFGQAALMDMSRLYLRWFDRWLKGIENGIDKEPLVSLFVMGPNSWLHGDRYPLPQTRFEKWYLAGEGRLAKTPPPARSAPDRYVYDPGDPTPWVEFYEDPDESKAPRPAEEIRKKAESYHADLLKSRRDILVYTTEPFDRPYTFVGPISAVLYASTSARDTDWYATLWELDSKGKFLKLGHEGKIRARFRSSMSKPELLKPGRIYEYKLDLWHSGITIPAGSRLQVEVASAVFPLMSRNLNTGGHNETETRYVPAKQTIYHDAKHPSHILLPVITAEARSR